MNIDPSRKAIIDAQREYWAFRKRYDERKPLYEKALVDAKKALTKMKLKHQRKATLRIAYIDGRLKSAYSVIRKGLDRDIRADKVFEAFGDVVGVRVVVNNLKDIEPLISEIGQHPDFKILKRENHGGEAPYRALHVQATCSVSYNDTHHAVPVEIQVHTLLQDAWAMLTHHDIYKNQAALPELAQPISRHLSDSLHALDNLADEFRQKIEATVEAPNDLSDEAPLNRDGIAFLYYEVLGDKPQEYEVEFLLKQAEELRLQTIGDVRKGLREDVLRQLSKIHDTRFARLPIGYDLLQFGMRFAVHGARAFDEYRKHIEDEWEEIERIGRAEILAEMPDTFDDFVSASERGDIPWDALEELGACSDCMNCGVRIFDPTVAAETVLDHYGFPETDINVEPLLLGALDDCPWEEESVNTSGVCPWCDHIVYMMSKDD